MRIPIAIITCMLLMSVPFIVQEAPPREDAACRFTVQGEATNPTIKGPDDLLPLVYVVEQPDSPIEITSVDLEGMWLSVSRELWTERSCGKYKVHNRSDRTVQAFAIQLRIQTLDGSGGSGATSAAPLAPGQSIEVGGCGGGGNGGAPQNKIRLLISVSAINFGNCFYRPSERVPASLGVRPVW